MFSRRVIGWAIADHLRASLVCAALRMAIATRSGSVADVSFHSDGGFPSIGDDHRVPAVNRRTIDRRGARYRKDRAGHVHAVLQSGTKCNHRHFAGWDGQLPT